MRVGGMRCHAKGMMHMEACEAQKWTLIMCRLSIMLWKEDQREFWDLFGGLSVIIFWSWITFGFLIPIFG